MFARADSPGIQDVPTPSAAPFPAWARAVELPESEAEAAFLAGAALARLDATLRGNLPWAGVLRRRLALRAAAASARQTGRSEGEAALRDAFHLTRPGADPGPAGRRLLAWRALTAGSTGQWRAALATAADSLQITGDELPREALASAEARARDDRPAPFAAARVFQLARPMAAPGDTGERALIAAWLADAVLARKLGWPFVLPLIATSLIAPAGRRAPRGEGDETRLILFGYASAAARACDLAAELGRRAQKLAEAAPRLRAKGAAAALSALLDEDSLSAATRLPGLSERGARRLFDRLVALGAVRELTGRSTFRLYGL